VKWPYASRLYEDEKSRRRTSGFFRMRERMMEKILGVRYCLFVLGCGAKEKLTQSII